MENEDDKTSEPNEPCWPFWGLLKNNSATVPFSSGHLHPNIGLHRAPSDIFERFESIVRKALRMLGRRTLQELRDSAAEIQLEIESSIDEYIRAQTKDLVDSLCKHGGYQLGYLPQGARGTKAEIKDLLDNWSSEWDDSSGLPQRDDLTDLEGLANYLEWNKYDEKTLVHCGLIEPEEHEHFAVLTLMIICDAIQKNPHPTYPNPESVARVKAIGHATISAIEAIGYADRIQFEEKIRKTVAAEQPTILAAEIETRIRDREIKAKQKLSEAGAKGAKVKNQLTDQLKVWALQQAAEMRGADRVISRKLSAQIPPNLAGASTDPERLIYDALRTRKTRT